MHEPVDLERSRLLLVWLQARRALDHCLSDLLAAGPAGERRVREHLELVGELEQRAREAFGNYRAAALSPALPPRQSWLGVANDLQLDLADVRAARNGRHPGDALDRGE